MAQGFSVRVYGTIDQQPPYAAAVNGDAGFIQATFASPQIANFPTTPVNIWPIQPGAKMNGVYCYGVIEVPASGLNVHSTKYVTLETAAVLATLRG